MDGLHRVKIPSNSANTPVSGNNIFKPFTQRMYLGYFSLVGSPLPLYNFSIVLMLTDYRLCDANL